MTSTQGCHGVVCLPGFVDISLNLSGGRGEDIPSWNENKNTLSRTLMDAFLSLVVNLKSKFLLCHHDRVKLLRKHTS